MTGIVISAVVLLVLGWWVWFAWGCAKKGRWILPDDEELDAEREEDDK